MSDIAGKRVFGDDELAGVVESVRMDQDAGEQALLQLDDGRRVLVPRAVLVPQRDGSYYLPLSAADINATLSSTADAYAGQTHPIIVPVITEELEIGKREIETGRVRVRKIVHEREEVVDEPLLREEVQVERVSVNQIIEQPVEVRYEGDTIIVPVLEEVLVVEKRLLLKEELHITRKQTTHREPQRYTLRQEEVDIERLPAQENERAGSAPGA